MTRRSRGARAGVPALAAVPLVVLAVFFVYPVLGIVGQGFVSHGQFAPGAYGFGNSSTGAWPI